MLKPGLEVIKLDYILKPKIKRNDSLLQTRVRKQSIIALYFEYGNELKLYNLEAKMRCAAKIPTCITKCYDKHPRKQT